ncbi:MAG: hypothetical protein E6Z25_05695 [Negativicoccus succinicivorans]|nr:hypothetical protein [Negativicoccus succinicivorans]
MTQEGNATIWLGFILGWLMNEVVWGLAIGILIGTWVDYFAQRRR